MCGITGIINLQNKNKIRNKTINEMVRLINHRGPDSKGVFINKNVALGNTRLAIIDLSESGNQPMLDKNKEIVIIYNGEIYNFLELRQLLISKGYIFRSDTDTEVVLNSYLEWGIDCIKKFNGMFSFCIHDVNKNVTFLVRDRLGIKPLYYSEYDGKLIFGSEIKTILA